MNRRNSQPPFRPPISFLPFSSAVPALAFERLSRVFFVGIRRGPKAPGVEHAARAIAGATP